MICLRMLEIKTKAAQYTLSVDYCYFFFKGKTIIFAVSVYERTLTWTCKIWPDLWLCEICIFVLGKTR